MYNVCNTIITGNNVFTTDMFCSIRVIINKNNSQRFEDFKEG